MTTFLNEDEIQQLTDRTRPSAQRRVLQAQKVPFRVSGDGRPVVARSHFDNHLKRSTSRAPNFDVMVLG